jgi:hypothetical protein
MVFAGRAIFLALGVAVFVALFTTMAPPRSAQAQEPDPEPNTLTIYKACEGVDDEGPFMLEIDFEFEPPGIDEATEIDEDSEFDILDLEISCDEAIELTGNDELDALFDWIEEVGVTPQITSATITITEVGLPDYVSDDYSSDCTLNLTELVGLESEGVVCVITNEFDLPDLTIRKVCPNGSGGGDFDVLIRRGATASSPLEAADDLNCGGTFDVEDLEPGTYRIHEVINGPNAANFVTSIVCVDAGGIDDSTGVIELVTLELGEDVQCVIINVLNGVPGAAPTVAPVVINNTNTNVINNTNANTNNNANTNTQQQSNQQTQVNDNNQTTTVNSGPEVNISGVPRPQAASPAQPAPAASPVTVLRGPSTGTGGLITPPRTGDAGLMDDNNVVGEAYFWVILGGIAGAAALGTLKFGRSGGRR